MAATPITVKQAKEQIIKALEGLRETGIIVKEINVSWITEVACDVPNPEGKIKAQIAFEADL